MKKLLSIFLCAIMVFSLASLAGCGKAQLKFGVGTYASAKLKANAADGENGSTKASVNIAAVLLDANGKVVDCKIDCAEYELGFTADGKAVAVEGEISTKYEKGDNYGMKKYGKAEKEWFEQIDALVGVIKGKTLDEVKALVATESKGSDAVVNAGCTIAVADYIKAVERAIENAKESEATEGNTLKIGTVSTQSTPKDATDEGDGTNEINTSITAAVLDKDNKVVAAYTDAVQVKATFNKKGEFTGKDGEITGKRDLGENYGMKKYGKAEKEWYEQAEAFDAALKGKTAADIAKLVTADGKGAEELQTAGCTIGVSDMVKAAEKAAK